MQIAPTSSVAPSTHGFAYLEILEVTGADSLTVKGDLTGMLAGDERFWILQRGTGVQDSKASAAS
jgi:hypothetical protein